MVIISGVPIFRIFTVCSLQCRMGALAALSVMVDGTKPLLSAAEERLVFSILKLFFVS